MKKILKLSLFIVILLFSTINIVKADSTDINLFIRSGETILYSDTIPLPPEGTVELNSHSLDADSVLAILNNADILSENFNISDLEYFDSFGSFYLKCITSSIGDDCDNWQYTVNDIYPGISMDQKILSGGENIYVYFGPQNKISLSSNNINTNDTLTVKTEDYDYENNAWIIRNDVTVGLTQTNPEDIWTPIEIQTQIVDENGQAIFSTIPIGIYNVGIKEDFYFPTETLTVIAPPIIQIQSSGGGGGGSYYIAPVEKKEFDIEKAFEFIISQQKENGSFGEDIYTDWIIISLASLENQDLKIEFITKIIKYLEELKTSNMLLTDLERHAMTLMAIGLNPYNTNNENYIKKITDSFDGKQFGNIDEDNDDIFALIVLQNAGFTQEDEMILEDISFILSKQKENGSWDESIDMTGAGIEALSLFSQNEQVKNALIKAKEFLKQKQKEDGGWGNVSSTAWTIEGILALSEKPEDWIKNDNTPLDYLAINQDIDGGIKNEYIQNKIWETAYTMIALSGKTWNQIMKEFEKPEEEIIKLEQKSLEKKLDEILLLLEKQKINENKEIKIISSKSIKKPAPKTEIKIISTKEDTTKDLKELANQNVATALSAVTNTSAKNIETIKKSWLKNILDKIFSIF